MPGDDLYPLEGGESSDAVGTLHHPQSPLLRDKVQLRVTSQKFYEYECPSHTADELGAMSNRRSRMELRGIKEFKLVDDVRYTKIMEYVERFSHATKSKL